ncbi:MAG: high frequency lysogenization protein HflD [Gammaproteobacteria bacterium]
MSNSLKDRVLALAGIFQAAKLVNDVAFRGNTDYPALRASIGSIFATDPNNVPEVYDGVKGVRRGLRIVRRIFDTAATEADLAITRYVFALITLEKKARKRIGMFSNLETRVNRGKSQAKHFDDVAHNSVLAALADTYVETIGTLSPRIMVNGEPSRLENPRNVDLIRALLLAGIRSAVLWRQCGGNKLTLLISRRAIRDQADTLLREVDDQIA